MSESNGGSRRLMGFELDSKINLSQIITGLGMIASVVWYASGLERRVALMEQQLQLSQSQQREVDARQDRDTTSTAVLLRADLGEIKATLAKLMDREMGRGRQ